MENLSKPAEPTLNVMTYGEKAAFLNGLEKAGYTVTTKTDGTLKIIGTDIEQVSNVWDIAAATGTSIRRLAPAQNSLEEIFFQAVSASEHP